MSSETPGSPKPEAGPYCNDPGNAGDEMLAANIMAGGQLGESLLSGEKPPNEGRSAKWRKRKMLRFTNSTRKTVLAERAGNARTIFSRFKGLLGTRELAEGHGLLLDPCNGIHMFWMTYAIDAVFVDRDFKVVGLVHNIKPWAVSKVFHSARACIELPPGTIERSATQLGDVLNFEPVDD